VNEPETGVMRAAHWKALLGLTAVTAALWVGLGSGVAVAQCAGRVLFVAPETATRGSVVVIRGQGWFGRCVDTGGACTKTGVFDPVQDIQLRITSGDKNSPGPTLATVDASDDFAFVVRARLPEGLAPGDYLVVATPADGSLRETARVHVT